MDIGVVFPQTELGNDRGAVRAIGEAVAGLGFAHLAAYDHVLGADTSVHGNLGGPYTIDDPFREPLTMFAYLAAITDLSFATSILIGPQRQTALLAKQAAEVDILSGGRFRLGLGVGWNKVEYDVLGMPFAQRGAILEEQIAVLRALWTQPNVTFDGQFHHIRAAGIAPLPVQRPIPIWIGAHSLTKRRARPGATCRGSSSRAGSTTPSATRRRSPNTRGAGKGRGRRTCPSSPCTPGSRRSTSTSARCAKWPSCCCSRPARDRSPAVARWASVPT
jgi:probable F420-dependent oxidoreductase